MNGLQDGYNSLWLKTPTIPNWGLELKDNRTKYYDQSIMSRLLSPEQCWNLLLTDVNGKKTCLYQRAYEKKNEILLEQD